MYRQDFVLLERTAAAASFFSKFPIHRVLNSINRRNTRDPDNVEFNLRHDHNSLLGTDSSEVGRFTKWSKEYWPPADTLVKHINAFAMPMKEEGRLKFCTNVTAIAPCQSEGCSGAYLLDVTPSCQKQQQCAPAEGCTSGEERRTYACKVVVMANGMWNDREVKDWIGGLGQHSIKYSHLSHFPEASFENKSVLVLGAGNAATETVDAIRNYARDIQVVARSNDQRLMKDTRYVGDLRGRRSTYIDAFALKSYEGHIVVRNGKELVLVRCGPTAETTGFNGSLPVCIFSVTEDEQVILAPVVERYANLVAEARAAFGDKVYTTSPSSSLLNHVTLVARMGFKIQQALPASILCISLRDLQAPMNPVQLSLLPRLRDTTLELTKWGTEFQKPVDVVIAALGWEYDDSLLSRGASTLAMMGPPHRAASRAYPKLSPFFETNFPNIYVVGAASHGRDRYRYKSSGGFLHGYRYTAKALDRILETRYDIRTPQQGPTRSRRDAVFGWKPRERRDLNFTGDTRLLNATSPLWSKLLTRINEAAGPYAMVGGALSDAIVYDATREEAIYIEDMPEEALHATYAKYPRIVWSYHWGPSHLQAELLAVCAVRTARNGVVSEYIHPVIQYWPPNSHPLPEADTLYARRHKLFKDEEVADAHPSTFWDSIPGVTRLHVKEAYIYLDWYDAGTWEVMQNFLNQAEEAAARFALEGGKGWMRSEFDEKIDVLLHTEKFQRQLKKACRGKSCKTLCGSDAVAPHHKRVRLAPQREQKREEKGGKKVEVATESEDADDDDDEVEE